MHDERGADERALARALVRLADEIEPPSGLELAAMARTAAGVRPADVVARRRAFGRRHALVLGLASALAAASAGVTIELGPRLRGVLTGTAQAQAPLGDWAWRASPPGVMTHLDRPTREAARTSGVLPGRVREVVALSRRGRRVSLLAAAAPGGAVCFALRAAGRTSPFDCLGRFDERAVVHFVAGAAEPLVSTRPRALVGIARSDVVRVVLVASDGRERELLLNPWRAFRYAGSRGESPLRLDAYGLNGSLVIGLRARGAPASLLAVNRLAAA